MGNYNPNSPASIQTIFANEGESLCQAGFREPKFGNPEDQEDFERFVAKETITSSNTGEI